MPHQTICSSNQELSMNDEDPQIGVLKNGQSNTERKRSNTGPILSPPTGAKHALVLRSKMASPTQTSPEGADDYFDGCSSGDDEQKEEKGTKSTSNEGIPILKSFDTMNSKHAAIIDRSKAPEGGGFLIGPPSPPPIGFGAEDCFNGQKKVEETYKSAKYETSNETDQQSPPIMPTSRILRKRTINEVANRGPSTRIIKEAPQPRKNEPRKILPSTYLSNRTTSAATNFSGSNSALKVLLSSSNGSDTSLPNNPRTTSNRQQRSAATTSIAHHHHPSQHNQAPRSNNGHSAIPIGITVMGTDRNRRETNQLITTPTRIAMNRMINTVQTSADMVDDDESGAYVSSSEEGEEDEESDDEDEDNEEESDSHSQQQHGPPPVLDKYHQQQPFEPAAQQSTTSFRPHQQQPFQPPILAPKRNHNLADSQDLINSSVYNHNGGPNYSQPPITLPPNQHTVPHYTYISADGIPIRYQPAANQQTSRISPAKQSSSNQRRFWSFWFNDSSTVSDPSTTGELDVDELVLQALETDARPLPSISYHHRQPEHQFFVNHSNVKDYGKNAANGHYHDAFGSTTVNRPSVNTPSRAVSGGRNRHQSQYNRTTVVDTSRLDLPRLTPCVRKPSDTSLNGSANRNRRYLSEYQQSRMEDEFLKHFFLSSEQMEQLATEIGVTKKQVTHWMVNRRVKARKLNPDGNFPISAKDPKRNVKGQTPKHGNVQRYYHH